MHGQPDLFPPGKQRLLVKYELKTPQPPLQHLADVFWVGPVLQQHGQHLPGEVRLDCLPVSALELELAHPFLTVCCGQVFGLAGPRLRKRVLPGVEAVFQRVHAAQVTILVLLHTTERPIIDHVHQIVKGRCRRLKPGTPLPDFFRAAVKNQLEESAVIEDDLREAVLGRMQPVQLLHQRRYIPPVSPQADAENPRMSMPRRDSRQFALHLHAQDTARIELEQLVGPLEQGGTQILQSYTEYPVCFVKRPAQSFLHPFILEYIGDGSFIQRCLRILKAAACRQNDDLHLGETGADVAHQRNTIFPGKTHVHHDDMRRQPPTELRHLFPALCDANALALVRQPGKVLHALQKGGIVIYKQYAQHNGFLLCSTSGTLFRSHLTE